MDDLVVVKACETAMEAQIAKGYLASNGIEAVVRADDEGGMMSGFQFGAHGVLVYVRKSDEAKAQQLLATQNVA